MAPTSLQPIQPPLQLEVHPGEEMSDSGEPVKPTRDVPRSYCLLAKQQLGLETHSIEQTVRETGESLLRLGFVKPRKPKAKL